MELDYVKLKEIKPALTAYIRESETMLKISAVPDDKVVHDIRVLMKKSRAALKLAAPQLERDSITRDIIALREVGRIMCSWRETAVLRKTAKELKKEFPAIFSKIPENEKIFTLLKKTLPVNEPSSEVLAGLERITDILKKAEYRIRFQSMNKLDPQLLIKELELSYLKVVKIYLSCRNNPKSVKLHKFRKRAKDFLYQLNIFRPLNPAVVKVLEKRLDILTQNLGRYNDLTQFIRSLDYNCGDTNNNPVIDELIIKIREKQDSYLLKVWPSAYKIFCPGQRLINVLGFKLLVI